MGLVEPLNIRQYNDLYLGFEGQQEGPWFSAMVMCNIPAIKWHFLELSNGLRWPCTAPSSAGMEGLTL